LRIISWLFAIPVFALAASLLYQFHAGVSLWLLIVTGLAVAWALLLSWIYDQLLRPLQTLSNVVAALREEDYSFRARGARRGDALGDLALEINALAADLQAERLSSLESAAMVRRVLEAIDAPVFAFDEQQSLRLLNPAAMRMLNMHAKDTLGKTAHSLQLSSLLTLEDEQVTTLALDETDRHSSDQWPRRWPRQWMVRRSSFRQHGVPHTLILLSDVSVALREEERLAWQRLIRVLGHEINNSLAPIKSIAGSLRQMLLAGAPATEFERPLEVIEQRAESLNHFLTAYRQLAQLPPPHSTQFSLAGLLEHLALLETRLAVQVHPSSDVLVEADKDQLAQAVINLLRNATEAALDNPERAPSVTVSWFLEESSAGGNVVIRIRDSGLGIANPTNLFVPFYTTKAAGTGTGLMLVKAILEAHGGSVALANHADGGALAELRLPL